MAVGVTIVTNSYNCKKLIFRFLDSLKKTSYKPFEVIVNDNGSIDNTLTEGRKKYKWVKWIDSGPDNLGWGGAYNVSFKAAKKGNHIVLMDSDVVPDKDMIKRLVDRLNSDKKIGIVTPMILYMSDHNWVNQAGAEVDLLTGRVHIGWGPKKDFLEAKPVQNSGTALLISRAVIEKIGGFDNWFTGYLDPDYCLRALRAGLTTWYEPTAIAYHDQSKDKEVWGPRIFNRAYMVGRNRTLFMRRHGKNIFVYLLFIPPLLAYYLKEALTYGVFPKWLELVHGTFAGFFYPLNKRNKITL